MTAAAVAAAINAAEQAIKDAQQVIDNLAGRVGFSPHLVSYRLESAAVELTAAQRHLNGEIGKV